MQYNAGVTEVAKVIASTIGTIADSPVLTGAVVDMSLYHRVAFICQAGTLNSTETADCLVETDSASAFNVTPATLASSTAEIIGDNQFVVIEVKASDLPAGDRYARATMTGSAETGGPGCITVIGYRRYSDYDDGTPNVVGEVDAMKQRVFA